MASMRATGAPLQVMMIMAVLLIRGLSAFSLSNSRHLTICSGSISFRRQRRCLLVRRNAKEDASDNNNDNGNDDEITPRDDEPVLPAGSVSPEAFQSLLKHTFGRARRRISEKNEYTAAAEMTNNGEEYISLDGDDLFAAINSKTSLRSQVTSDLLGKVVGRAKRTLSTKSDDSTTTMTNPLLHAKSAASTTTTTTSTTTSTMKPLDEEEEEEETTPTPTPTPTIRTTKSNNQDDNKFLPTDLRYNQNPAISLTALAHWLWSSVLRPHEDSAIDATCGNGHDSMGIARILFANEDLFLDRNSELICIDVQERACTTTKEGLSKIIRNPSTLDRQVRILQQSHAPLPLPTNASSVALVVYNLGYLPNSSSPSSSGGGGIQTQVESTLESITDALLLIRVGGMVSIMTYPRTNVEEDFAVRALLEGTVTMSNKQGPDWSTYVSDLDCTEDLKSLLMSELNRISSFYDQQNLTRTFRVTEHKKIGLTQAPILMTATRIK